MPPISQFPPARVFLKTATSSSPAPSPLSITGTAARRSSLASPLSPRYTMSGMTNGSSQQHQQQQQQQQQAMQQMLSQRADMGRAFVALGDFPVPADAFDLNAVTIQVSPLLLTSDHPASLVHATDTGDRLYESRKSRLSCRSHGLIGSAETSKPITAFEYPPVGMYLSGGYLATV
ncbi:hypothetical protein DDE82_006561 [Stemphylium lycopersici]|uniref:Uncharacterized protein n=1 Tax=Stemphylium lycopersici TaxID=183478 RepID=A0A364N2E5_STELY|nr:hypothetical protein TW65_06653 [Stemphylium lycopersici]RAR01348.1 hypothetical protein DDE82_006561 [Stemphylium lycopersici]RAR09963.1 hypothetical protein DDE83_005272 [Stemphylium lycopersici]